MRREKDESRGVGKSESQIKSRDREKKKGRKKGGRKDERERLSREILVSRPMFH